MAARAVIGISRRHDEGYAVETAPDGRAALTRILADPPDLVITDVMMPHLDGIALLHQVRAQVPALPMILLSAGPSARWRRTLPPHTAFLAKPFDLEVLLERIAHFTTAGA